MGGSKTAKTIATGVWWRIGVAQGLPLSGNYSAAEEALGTWVSFDLAAAIPKLASVVLKARRQNELSLIRTRMIRSGRGAEAPQRFISRTVKPYRAPREHYAIIADCIHR